MDVDYSDIFDIENGGRPATFFPDASDTSVSYEINIAFSRDRSISSFGPDQFNNPAPTAWAQATDVPGISNNSKLIVHYGYLEDESGEAILDESGEPIIAENEFTYFIKSNTTDAFGLTEMQLSLNQ